MLPEAPARSSRGTSVTPGAWDAASAATAAAATAVVTAPLRNRLPNTAAMTVDPSPGRPVCFFAARSVLLPVALLPSGPAQATLRQLPAPRHPFVPHFYRLAVTG
ncbi:hypothetical protein GCM10010277_46020 [Streptomyces longisporoflavus]|nr:hypothetical protein GCM10010277_46020 [Streptomyces longisporoflavus]